MKAGGDAAPFDLGDDDAYEDWRRQKLKNFPVPPEALVAAARDALKSVLDGRGRLIYRARFMDRVAGS